MIQVKDDRNADIKDLLKKEGYRNTPARRAIISLLKEVTSPITAEDLFLLVKDLHGSINLSTIYRSLDLFTSKGILNKIVFNDGKARYELNRNDHRHHLVCLGCNKTIPISNCPLHLLENQVEKETEFSITGHSFEIYGYCSKCKGQKEKHPENSESKLR